MCFVQDKNIVCWTIGQSSPLAVSPCINPLIGSIMPSPLENPHPASTESASTWSIADVERDTGLGKDTLRVWEKRYGFPAPARDAQGERLYPTEQVHHLHLIKRLLDVGHRPGKVVPLPLPQLQALLAEPAPLQRRTPAIRETVQFVALPDDPDTPWLRWLQEDRNDLIRQALQTHVLRQGLGVTVEQLVAPLCMHVGDAWWRGEISIYQEHLFTETLQSVLREAISSLDAVDPHVQTPRVLLTTLPGEQHGLGLLMAECFFALESCQRFVLGVSTPVADIVQAAQQLKIDVVALSFSAHAARRDLGDGLMQLIGQLPAHAEVWAGGAGAVLHGRFAPPSVHLIQRAGDLPLQIRRWRDGQPADAGIIRA